MSTGNPNLIMSTPFHLSDKTILITGASSGIGRQAAISISQMGGRCIITGRNEAELSFTYQHLHGEGHVQIAGDLTDASARERIIKAIPELDGMAYCAGNVIHFPIRFVNQKHMDEMMKLNFEAPVFLSSALLKSKKFRAKSSLVYISSISSQFPPKGGAMY
jgi:short-subunit dehydrogenase